MIEDSDQAFDDKLNKGLVLLYFVSSHCIACLDMKPRVIKLSKKLEPKISIAIVDVDNRPDLENKYCVNFLPTTIILKNGKELDRDYGNQTDHEFLKFISESIDRNNQLIYTVGAIQIYNDLVKAGLAYKSQGGSVWETYNEAYEYVGRVWVENVNVPARVYGVKAKLSRDAYNGKLKRPCRLVFVDEQGNEINTD